jgi:hypothetical protein
MCVVSVLKAAPQRQALLLRHQFRFQRLAATVVVAVVVAVAAAAVAVAVTLLL